MASTLIIEFQMTEIEYVEFIKSALWNLKHEVFEQCKNCLVEGLIKFSVIEKETITKEILAEKLCDYFETLEVKTNKPFSKFIEFYLRDLDEIVGPHIQKDSLHKYKKGKEAQDNVSRARKYYEKVVRLRREEAHSFYELVDYTRVMMCLYTAILTGKSSYIDNFNFSAECLDMEGLVKVLKNEKITGAFPQTKRQCFDTRELYSQSSCNVVMIVLLLSFILNYNAREDL